MSNEDFKERLKTIIKYVCIGLIVFVLSCVVVGVISQCSSCTTVSTGSSSTPAPSQVNFNTSNSIEK